MEKDKPSSAELFGKLLASAILFSGTLFVTQLLGPFVGAFSGWVVGIIFPQTFGSFFDRIGLHGFFLWQLGAVFGWVSGFMRTKVEYKPKQ